MLLFSKKKLGKKNKNLMWQYLTFINYNLFSQFFSQMVFGGSDVCIRVGRGGIRMGVPEVSKGVGGGGIEGVSVFTSNPFIAGSDFRSVAVAA
jgi:hypothetical protein